MGNNRTLETLQQMLNDYRSTEGITNRIVLDKTIKNNCDITARACKRVGDDVALRLKNDPNAKLVIVGFADSKEPKAAKLAQTRADLAKKYIVEKGVDASRISTRTGEASKEKGQEKANRRVDFIVVPEGATY